MNNPNNIDIFEIWDVIEASFLFDYGIDVNEEMSCRKFILLLKNLSPESPFARLMISKSNPPKEIQHKQVKSNSLDFKDVANSFGKQKAG